MAAVEPSTRPPDDQPPAPRAYEEPVAETPDEPVDETAVDPPDGAQASMPETNDPEGELEELEDRSMPIPRTLWSVNEETGVRHEETYMQQGLMWFGKLELYGLLGQALKVVLEGENPLGIGSLLDMANNPRKMIVDMMGSVPGAATAPDRVSDEMEMEAGKVLAAFAQVVSIAPELITQAYCIALAIPKGYRNWAANWAFPNMDDEMGKDILHAFVDQNWGVMEDFFAHEVPKIIRRVIKARQQHSDGRR